MTTFRKHPKPHSPELMRALHSLLKPLEMPKPPHVCRTVTEDQIEEPVDALADYMRKGNEVRVE